MTLKPIKLLLSYIPQRLPVGMAEFETFTDDIIELGVPTKIRDSVQWVISSAIQHSSKTKLSKQHFVQLINKSAANQIASQVFLDIKNRQQAALEAARAEELAKQSQAAVTAPIDTPYDAKILSNQEI